MPIELTNENYHSIEMRQAYMSYSQFKMFCECEVQALAYIRGEYERPLTEALLFGSWVDAHFSGEEEQFIAENKDKLYSPKTGQIYAAFKGVQKVIDFIESDPVWSKYWKLGQHQRIMTGVIAGVVFKIKMDAYFPGKVIIDWKCMKDMADVWIDTLKKYANFIIAYRYDLEGAIFREIESQNSETHEKLPFVLSVVTKEEYPDKELIEIEGKYLDVALQEVIEKAPRFQRIKMGLEEPVGCGKCPVCRMKKKITGIKSYEKLFLIKEGE